jgi:hypothetical protein
MGDLGTLLYKRNCKWKGREKKIAQRMEAK